MLGGAEGVGPPTTGGEAHLSQAGVGVLAWRGEGVRVQLGLGVAEVHICMDINELRALQIK